MSRIHANNFSTTLNGSITSTATSIVLTSVSGFPTIGSGVVCNVTLQNGSTVEIVQATAQSSYTLTVTRGAEGTTAQSIASGSTVEIRPTADSIDRKADTASLGTLATQNGTFSGTSSGTNTGDQTITLTGDITGSGTGSFSTTIAANAVTLAKMANLAANSFIGNNTGSSATPIALTVSQVKSALSLNLVENTASSTWAGTSIITTLGTIATGVWQGTPVTATYGGTGRASATAYAPIVGGTTSTGAQQSMAAGSTGQIMQSGGSSAVPTWSTPTYPSSSGTARKILVSDGTNIVYSTETYAVPGTAGNVLTSDGTNWTSAAPSGGGGGGLTIVLSSSSTISALVNHEYISTYAGLCTITLPAACTYGDVVKITGNGNGTFKLVANTSQTINGLGTATSSAGSITPASGTDTLQVSCCIANNTWNIDSFCSTLLTFA